MKSKESRMTPDNPMTRQYNSLAERFAPGQTEIWYWKDSYASLSFGFDYAEKENILPSCKDLEKTHIKLGTLAETNKERIYQSLQGEVWSPNGEATKLVRSLGISHTSLSVGDIIKLPNGICYFVDLNYFKELPMDFEVHTEGEKAVVRPLDAKASAYLKTIVDENSDWIDDDLLIEKEFLEPIVAHLNEKFIVVGGHRDCCDACKINEPCCDTMVASNREADLVETLAIERPGYLRFMYSTTDKKAKKKGDKDMRIKIKAAIIPMDRKINNPLPADDRRIVCDYLNATSYLMLDYANKVKLAHWNTRGPLFNQLHEFFDEIHGHTLGFVDLMAERVLQLGAIVDLDTKVVGEKSDLKPYPLETIRGLEHVKVLVNYAKTIAQNIHQHIEKCLASHDNTTADIYTEISRQFEKDLWMLEAHLDGEA